MGERLSLRTGSAWRVTPASEAAVYVDLAPGAGIARWVERLFIGRETLCAPVEEHVVPDGSVSLLFNLGDPPRVDGGDPGHAAEVSGAATGPVRLRMAGRLDQLGVRLRAGAVGAILVLPAGALAGRTVPLENLWGRFADEAVSRLAEAPFGPERLAVLERILAERTARVDRAPRGAVFEAIRRIEASRGRVRVRELSAVGLGERRLEQAFHEDVGLSPKALCRIVRLRASLPALSDPSRPLSEVAREAGFSDQAHLGNEVRRLTGLTPGALRVRASDSSKTAEEDAG